MRRSCAGSYVRDSPLPASIAVAEKAPGRHAALSEHGVRVTDDTESACIGANIVLLAVKPQDLAHVSEGLRGALAANSVLVSIAAGSRWPRCNGSAATVPRSA